MKRIFTIALVGLFVSVSMTTYAQQWTANGATKLYFNGSVGIGSNINPVGALQVQTAVRIAGFIFRITSAVVCRLTTRVCLLAGINRVVRERANLYIINRQEMEVGRDSRSPL